MLVLGALTTGRCCVEDARNQVCALPSALSARALRLAWVCAHRLAPAHLEALFCACFAHVASSHTFFLPNLLSGATHHLKRCLSVVVTLQDAGIVRANGHCTQARETPLRATLQDAHHERCKHVPTPSAGYTALVDMIMGLSGSFFRDMLSPKVSIGVGAALWQQLADRPLLRRWRRVVLRESAGGGVSGTPTAGAVSGELPLHAFGPRPLHASPSRMTPSFDPWAACASHPPTTVSSIPASADP